MLELRHKKNGWRLVASSLLGITRAGSKGMISARIIKAPRLCSDYTAITQKKRKS